MIKRFTSRFEITPGMHRPKRIRNGAIALGVFGLALFCTFAIRTGGIPLIPKGGKVVYAEFTTAANVSANRTPVRVRGVQVGVVEKVERLPGGRGVKVKMRIKDKNGKVPEFRSDAKAHIYWRTLLGFSFYIQLDPGSSPRKLADNTIKLGHTDAQVELDQVLAALKPPTRKGIQQVFRGFDKGFRGGDPGSSIDELGPAMKQIDPGLHALQGERQGDLSRAVYQAGRLMGNLQDSNRQLAGLVQGGDTTLGVTARRRADIGATLQKAPTSLDETTLTMRRLRTTLGKLDPVAERLRPGARRLDNAATALRPALRELRPTLDDARPLLRRLRPTLRALYTTGRLGSPAIRGLTPTFTRLQTRILPWLDKMQPSTQVRNYQSIGPFFAAISSSSSQFDLAGHVQTFQAVAGGGDSASFLPCSPTGSLTGLQCQNFNQYLGRILGLPVSSSAKAKSGSKK